MAAAGAGGAALREGRRPRGAQRWRASPRRGGAAEHPQRCGGTPALTGRDSRGEKAGKQEGRASKLTGESIWAEGVRKGELDGRGKLGGTTMAAGGLQA